MKALLVLLAAAESGHKPPPLVDIDATVFIQFGIFLFLLVVLTKLVFRPYLALRAERMANIDGASREAEHSNRDADEKLSAYEERIKKARKEAAAVRTDIRAQGEGRSSELLVDARARADAKVESARQQIERSAQAAKLALRTRADQLARSIASKLLGREV